MDAVLRRWVLACAVAEAIGMTAAASAAKASQAWVGEPAGGGEIAGALAVVVVGGLIEGTSLGTAQSWALRLTHPAHRRGRYLVVTVVVAGLGWAGASTPAALGGAGAGGAEPSRALVVLGGAGLGLLMGCLLGAAQAWSLRDAVERPAQWVVANAVAWVPAMGLIFLGATAPGAQWAWWRVALLGALTGAAAGTVLGLVLGRWVPRLGVRPAA